MATYASQLIGKVGIEGAEKAKSELKAVGEQTHKTSESFGMLKNALSFAAGQMLFQGMRDVIGAGADAVKMAGDFQSGMTSLVTGAGEAEKNIGLVSKGILKMSVDTGTTTKQLTDGMYMIESAGFHGAAGLKVLQAAAEGAKVGNADLATVANGVTTIMVDYAKQHITAAQATNMLVATVAAGKTHMQDLAAALSTIAPTAAAVGLHVTDMNAALATMTGEGTAAADASTYLRQLLMSLEAPASQTVTTLRSIGLTAAQVADGMKASLPQTLQLITDHLKKKFPEGSAAYVNALKDIAGGARQMEGILQLTGTHLQVFKDNVTGITDSVTKGGTAITGWAKVQEDFNFKMDTARAKLEAFGIQIGTALMPKLTELLGYVELHILPRLDDFSNWFQHDGIPLLSQFGTDIGNVIGWFQQGGPAVDLIKDSLIAVGGAIATIKIAVLANDMMHMVTVVIPETLTKYGLWAGAANAVAVSEAGIGTAAEGAALATEGATAAAGAGFTAMLGPIGLATAAIIVLGQLLTPTINANAVKPPPPGTTAPGINGPNTPVTGDSGLGRGGAVYQHILDLLAQKDAQKALNAQIEQAYRDMSDLTDKYQTGNVVLGHLTDLTGSFSDHLTAADAHANWLRSSLEKVDAHYQPRIITTDIEKAMNLARITKLKLEDLASPVSIQIGTRTITDAINKMAIAKAQVDDLGGVPIKSITGHASGILNNPSGHWAMVGERGPEPMYVPQGASILPSGTLPGMSNSNSNTPVVFMIDGIAFARGMMPYMVDQMRNTTGVRF